MKKILTIVLLLISSIVLVACAGDGVDKELPSPKNVAILDGIVTWSAVTDADEYTVIVGTRSFTTELTTFDLKTQNIMVGTHTVVVLAVKAGKSSLPSSNVSYVVVPANLEAVIDDVLAAIDPSYTADMTEDDFEDPWDYENYRNLLRLSRAYSTAAVNVGMSEEDSVGFFNDFYEMANEMDIENVSDLMTKLEMFENNNMTPFGIAYVLYELIKVAMEMNIEYQQEYILEKIDNLENHESYVDSIKARSGYISAKNKFMSYTIPSNVALAEEFFAGTNDELYDYTWIAQDIAYDFYNYGYSSVRWYDWNEEDPYIAMLFAVISNAHLQADYDYLENLTWHNGLYELKNLYSANQSYQWDLRDLERSQENVLILIETLSAMEDNEVAMVASLEVVIEFLMTFKNSLPQNVITLFDDLVETGELSMEEYFIIKDGVVGVLIDTLPSASDFGVLYTALFYVGGAVSGVDMSSYMTHASFLGELDYAFLDLFLALIDDMDQQTLEDIIAIVEEIQTEEKVYYSWSDDYYYYIYTTDETKVVELAVYILTYVDSFVSANQAKVDALNALLDNDAMEDLFTLVMEQVKVQIANSYYWMDDEEIELITNMIDDLVADYDHIKAGLAVFEEIGVDLIDKFIATEGAMFIKLFELQDLGEDPEDAVQMVEELLDMFAEYNSIFVAGMTQADIQLALRMFKVPLLFAIAQGDPDKDYSATFDTLLPFISNVISNLLTIEQQVVTVAKNMELSAIIFDPKYDDEGMGAAAALMQGANLVLTPSIELLIKQTVTIVIDNILKNADLMVLHGMSLNDLNDAKTMLNDTLTDIFAEVHVVAAYDFANLTPAQEERLNELAEMIQSLLMLGFGSMEPIN